MSRRRSGAAARERYDRARSEKALAAARAAAPARLEKIEQGALKLDAYGVGSRLLLDYEALQTALATSYPDAKLSSLRGDEPALAAAQAAIDERLGAMLAWLEQAERAGQASP